MGVGSVTSMNNMSSIQMARAGSKDVKSKKIQNEITDLQQKMQKVSSNEALSASEKADERKKQQKEISSLNTELKRQQEEFLRSQKRELVLKELQKDKKPTEEGKAADTPAQETEDRSVVIFKNSDGTVILKGELNQDDESSVDADKKQADESKEEGAAEKRTKSIESDDKDTGLSDKKIHAIVSGDASAQQISHQRAVVTRIRGDIAVLKGEINQDERHGINTDKKQAELEKLERQEEQVRTFQNSAFGEKNHTRKPEAKMKVSGIQSRTEDDDSANAFKLSKEEAQASQQRFYVSFGN